MRLLLRLAAAYLRWERSLGEPDGNMEAWISLTTLRDVGGVRLFKRRTKRDGRRR